MSYIFTEGPIDQPWETTEDVDACWYVHRAGFWQRNRAMPPESTVVENNFYVQGPKWATELAARLNERDALRRALERLCGAVAREQAASGISWQLTAAAQVAREVLG